MKSIVQVVQNLLKPYIDSNIQTLANDIAYINTSSTTASKAYVKGEQFILNGVLRKAKTAISSGATLTLNSNYENADSVATQITPQDISSGITSEHGTFNVKQAYIIGNLVIIAYELVATSTLGSGQTLLSGIPTPKGNFQTFTFRNGSTVSSGYTDSTVFATNSVISSGDKVAGSLVYVKA